MVALSFFHIVFAVLVMPIVIVIVGSCVFATYYRLFAHGKVIFINSLMPGGNKKVW